MTDALPYRGIFFIVLFFVCLVIAIIFLVPRLIMLYCIAKKDVCRMCKNGGDLLPETTELCNADSHLLYGLHLDVHLLYMSSVDKYIQLYTVVG